MHFYKDSVTLRKPNSTLVMVPRVGKLNPVARKMYNVMLHLTQQQVSESRVTGQVIEATHMFGAQLERIVAPITNGDSDPRTIAKQYLREMRRIEVDWEAPDSATGVIWNSMGLISQAKLEIINNVTWVYWALPPDILSAVSDPERYTPLDLTYMANLKSYVAIALYEICSRYKNNPTGVTSKNPPAWWVDALTNIPAEKDPVTGELRRREWRKLKNEQVAKAIEEINKHTDLIIKLFEFKEVKAVTAVQFGVQKKKNDVAKRIPMKISRELAERAVAIGVPLPDIMRLLDDGHSESDVMFSLARLDAREKRADLEPVKARSGYLRRLLEAGVTIEGPVGIAPEEEGEVKPPPPRQDLVVADPWREQRRKEITAELFALSPQAQQTYIEMATQDLRDSGFLSATIARKLAAGDWKGGVILTKVFDSYAKTHYGADWHIEQGSAQQAALFGDSV
ncbi:hypothetical protein [Polaromonas sp.]|uniref:hypothetical protein n=1 Tax=Polaromonas sp. TaxID=1869339 RepID=UPI00352AE211